jgi:hypothetical protein
LSAVFFVTEGVLKAIQSAQKEVMSGKYTI